MTDPKVAPYGSWKSPITTDLMLSESIRLGHIALDGANTYWIEIRISEGGRSVIVRRTPDGQITDITPPQFNARTMAHEYGGGDFTVSDGIIYFSNFADQKLYRQVPGSVPEPITSSEYMRYADAVVDLERKRLICVREDHSVAGREAVNTLISLPLDGNGEAQVLVSGNDFYSSPRVSPGGSLLAWLTWNHPNMPWDGTELWVGEFQPDGSIGRAEKVAGGDGESIFQPEWSPDGVLHFVSDRTGWWNLYRWLDGRVESLYEMAAEFGQPQWIFGMSTYGFVGRDHIICKYVQQGNSYLASLNTVTGKLDHIEVPYSTIRELYASPEQVVFAGGSPTEPWSIIELDLDTYRTQVLRRSSSVTIEPGYLSIPEPIEFPTEHGLTAYAFYYPPHNRDYVAPENERPPLIVHSHGGPTGSTDNVFNLGIQYGTSRGFAVLDVNYGGSTGYGREYRRRLEGQWGVVDIDDCVNGARYLVERGLADGNRLAITGGSAGGYTTLAALTFRDTFKAGASHYGLSDLEAFVKHTHKFESRYLERLVGPYPEQRDLFYQRSPIHFTDRISCPVIFFQGLDDKIVLPNQAEILVEALRKKGLPVAYVAFPGESHGFRRAENIKRATEGELYFYSRIFGFPLAEPVESVPIENF
jgi:dipeptidyl aminopeptidase/acylaminoacyl peptidase